MVARKIHTSVWASSSRRTYCNGRYESQPRKPVALHSRSVHKFANQATWRSQERDQARTQILPSVSTSGTMTSREKELFSKIFNSILAKESQSSSDYGNHVVFDSGPKDQPGPQQSVSKTMALEFFRTYPTQARDMAGQRDLQTATNHRPKPSASYLRLRSKLIACQDIQALNACLDESVFGPFARDEISWKTITSKDAQFLQIYPSLLATAMCLMRLSFRNPTGSVAIFRRIKDYGVASEATGAEVQVYHELLLALFEGWHDLKRVENALLQMEADGVEMNEETKLVLKYIRQEIIAQREKSSGANAYWSHVSARTFERLSSRIHLLEKQSTSTHYEHTL